MSNNFAKVYGWGCAFRKGVKTSKRGKIAWWGKTNEFYTLRQKVGIILSDNFCHVVFWFRPHARGDMRSIVQTKIDTAYRCKD